MANGFIRAVVEVFSNSDKFIRVYMQLNEVSKARH